MSQTSADRIPGRTAAAFVVGSPRSGTSVMAWALAAHPEMVTGPEADFPYHVARLFGEEASPPRGLGKLKRLARTCAEKCWQGVARISGSERSSRRELTSQALEYAWRVSRGREDGWLATHAVRREEFLAAIGLGLERLFDERSEGLRWIDSSPISTLACESLRQMFPRASFVHVLRDGRATVGSMINSGFDELVAKNFRFACETWELYARIGHRFATECPDRCIEVRHDELVANPESEMRRILNFLNLDWDDSVVQVLTQGRINSSWGNQSPSDVSKPKPESLVPEAPWRSWSRRQKSTFLDIAAETMTALGYDCDLD